MEKYFKTIGVLLLTLVLQSCEKETMRYEGEPGNISGIYFLYSSSYTMSGGMRIEHYQDSIEVTFAQVPANLEEMTVNLPVRVLGNLSDKERAFKVKVSSGTAVENVDYQPLQEEYMMPANQESTSLPLVLLRTDKLKKEKLDLTIELVENDNFKLLLPVKINDDGKTEVVTTHIKVIFSEIYTESWQYQLFGRDIFGPFTVKKFEFVNTVMHWSPSDWDDGTVTYGILPYAGRKVQAELQERADKNTPEYDEDGSFMQLEAPYTVDYSKYETE
jgi:lipoprotein